jgi:iron complex outermembrane receptor protein
MKRFFLCLMAASVITSNLSAKTTTTAEPIQKDSVRNLRLDDVTIIGNRAGSRTPVAQTNLDSKQIQSMAVATNMPHVLWMTPSLVATSENGTGTGYSYLRIRGTDASRINITLNGIPQNNPESQEMYWVDLPDLASSLQSIQIQRGVGTSANGSGAFGASINMVSKSPGMKPYLESATTVGSYGTFQENVAAGTGVFGNGYSFDLRYSKLVSEGYIRNGWCDHESLTATFAKRFAKAALRFNYIYGKENTGITWEGISQDKFDTDPTYNPAGEKPDGSYYDNQSDNYWQHHFQLFYTQELSNELLLSAGLNYTDGFGYYEEYKRGWDKTGIKFEELGLANQTVNGVTYTKTDLICRKNMDNGFYTGNFNLQYKRNSLNIQGGGMYSLYNGTHFAKLLWAERNENLPYNLEWARNHAAKTDANFFTKAEYAFGKGVNAYVDLQYRFVDYQLIGVDDDDAKDLTQHRVWNFFNPKTGLFWNISPESKFFISVAVAHREPTRADIKDSRKAGNMSDIRAEQLKDYEIGYTFDNQTVMFSVNIYDMHYTDQLVATGKLNEVGYALMSNVPDSYRRGGEFQLGFKPFKWLQVDANTTLSMNRVKDYTVYFDTYDNSNDWGSAAQLSQHFEEMKLPYSPEVIAAIGLTIKPMESISLNLTTKYVGEQYYTNTQNNDLKLPAYNQTNFNASWDFRLFNRADAQLGLVVNNLFSNKYACNAWGYEAHFANGDPTYVEKGLYVVAPKNYLAKFVLKF